MMYYVYVLRSLKDSKFYIGYTKNLEKRLNEHNNGKVIATKFRYPFEPVAQIQQRQFENICATDYLLLKA